MITFLKDNNSITESFIQIFVLLSLVSQPVVLWDPRLL